MLITGFPLGYRLEVVEELKELAGSLKASVMGSLHRSHTYYLFLMQQGKVLPGCTMGLKHPFD